MKKENLLIVVVILFSCFMFPNNASAMCAIQARIGDIRNEIDDAVCFLGTGETSKNNDVQLIVMVMESTLFWIIIMEKVLIFMMDLEEKHL